MRVIVTKADVTPDILDSVEDCVGWFDDERTMGTEAFVDRLCNSYGSDFDIESYDNEAVRYIMRVARSIRAETRI